MLSVQHVSTGGAGTALGTDFPPENPNPWQIQSYQGCGVQTQPMCVPILPKDACAPHKQQLLPRGGVGNGISPGTQGLGGAGEARWGCVSEAAVSEPA